MADSFQLDLVMTRGLEGGADDKIQAPGAFIELNNWYYDQDGSLIKRPRFDAAIKQLPDTSSISGTPKRMTRYGSTLAMLTHQKLYEYSPTDDKAYDRGAIPEWSYPERTVIQRDVVDPLVSGAAVVANGYRIFCWIVDYTSTLTLPRGSLAAAVYTADGALVFYAGFSDIAQCPRLTVTGNTAVLWWLDGSSSPYDLKYATLDCSSTPTAWSSATTLASDIDASRLYDVDYHSDGTHVFALYNTSGDLYVGKLNTTLNLTHSQTYAESADWSLNIYTDGTRVCVSYGYSATPVTKARMFAHSDLTQNVAATNLLGTAATNVVWHYESATGNYLWSASFVSGSHSTRKITTGTLSTGGSVLVVDPSGTWHVQWASRLFEANNRIYGVVTHGFTLSITGSSTSSEQYDACFTLVELDREVVATLLLRPVAQIIGGGLAQAKEFYAPTSNHVLQDVVATATGYMVAYPELFRFEGTNDFFDSGIVAYELRDDDYKSHEPAELGTLLAFTGGLTSVYDGQEVTELGFAWAPKVLSATVGTPGSNNWSYVCTYIWEDAQGNLHESAPGLAKAVTSADPNVALEISSLSLTAKHRPSLSYGSNGRRVAIRIYRTLHNGSVYYLVGDVECDTDAEYTSYTDTSTDASIGDNLTLYTQGGVVPPRDLFASSHVTVWDNRLVFSAAGNAYMTTQWAGDRAPYATEDGTHVVSTQEVGDITALAEMDGALLLFKSRGIYAVSGIGPSSQGGTPPNPPRRVSADAGCIDARSVALCDRGVVFQSVRGLYLLPRGFGNVQWLGKPALATLETYPHIFDACVVPRRNHLMWLCNDSLTSVDTSTILVWDYDRNAWFTWTPPASGAGVADALSLVELEDKLYLWEDRVYLHTESTTGLYVGDNNSTTYFVSSSAETTNIRPSNYVTGYARVWSLKLLGELIEPDGARLIVTVAYDDGALTDSIQWDITGSEGDSFMREFVLPWQKVNAVRFRVEDSTGGTSGRGRGIRLNAMTLTIVPRSKAGKPLREAYRAPYAGGGGGGS